MIRVFFIVVTVLAASPARAQEPIRLTPEQAIARGIEASERLVELSARQDAARAVEAQRESAARPQIAAIASYTRTNHVEEFTVPNPAGGVRVIYPDVPDNVRSRLDLQWPIYTAGRVGALSRAAAAETEAAGHDRDAARADVKLEITRAFWAVITARASRDVVREALQRIDAHLADVKNQLSVGLVPPSDVLTVEAQRAHQQTLSIEAENIFETASADFRRLAGLDADAPFELIAELRPAATPPNTQIGALNLTSATLNLQTGTSAAVAEAREHRAERKSLQFRINAAAERVTAASTGSLPVVTAVGGYDMARPNPRIFPIQEKWKPSWDVGVQFRWSLFDGGRARAETAEAAANRRAAEARLREFDKIVGVEVRQRLADVSAARASIAAAEAGLAAAAEAHRVLAERFGAGVATNTDVLGAHVALLQAQLDLTRAAANAHLATARLDRALGR
jgi:outer membrane protein